jgi:hypothetical protein
MCLAQGLSQAAIRVLVESVLSAECSTGELAPKFIQILGWIQFLVAYWSETIVSHELLAGNLLWLLVTT